jgi:membrane protein YqaA with SNARE-associated domain
VTKRQLTLARIIALLIVVGISILIFNFRDRASQLAIYGYPGIFILAFLAYATVLLPAPGVAVIFAMGAVFNPVGVAVAAGAGAALGELSGYLAGFSGQAILERASIYDRLTQWMKVNGPLTILLLSAVPNPFFDIVGVIAGVLKVRMPVFLFWCWIGETLKMLFFALAGSGLLN